MKIKMFLAVIILSTSAASYAGFGLGADIYSRYVWRGTDFGNSVSVQPVLTYTIGGFEVGAWASYPISSDSTSIGSNENDLYVTYSFGNFGLTITDYYFPEGGDVFNYNNEGGTHFLEVSASYALGPVSLLAGYFFLGDTDHSIYGEIGYGFYEKDDIEACLTVGLGNGMYVVEDTFSLVNIGLTLSKGNLSASYIINPDKEVNFFVFGYRF